MIPTHPTSCSYQQCFEASSHQRHDASCLIAVNTTVKGGLNIATPYQLAQGYLQISTQDLHIWKSGTCATACSSIGQLSAFFITELSALQASTGSRQFIHAIHVGDEPLHATIMQPCSHDFQITLHCIILLSVLPPFLNSPTTIQFSRRFWRVDVESHDSIQRLGSSKPTVA